MNECPFGEHYWATMKRIHEFNKACRESGGEVGLVVEWGGKKYTVRRRGMRLHEAIEKVLAGEKVRLRDNAAWEIVISGDDKIVFTFMGNIQAEIPNEVLSSYGWEVVEPEPAIAVGDTVYFGDLQTHKQGPCKDGANCILERMEGKDRFLLMREDCFCIESRFKALKLIHKGPKVIDGPRIIVSGNGRYHEYQMCTGLKDGAYKTTLTPMEDKG